MDLGYKESDQSGGKMVGFGYFRGILLSFGCLRTDTGTMTVGGGELRVPAARACCRGGMVLQYSDGMLGFGLGPTGLIMRSRA